MVALEWAKEIGALLVSWPIVAIVSLILFRKPIFKFIDQFSNFEFKKAKIGPVEIEKEITILTEKINKQEEEQGKQQTEIDSLRFLITNFVTNAELIHLENLKKPGPYIYEKAPYFELELRRLRSFGLIINHENQGIRTMPQKGDLKDYFKLTESGENYLNLR